MIGNKIFGYLLTHLGTSLQWLVHLGTKKYNDLFEMKSSYWVGFIFFIIIFLAYIRDKN